MKQVFLLLLVFGLSIQIGFSQSPFTGVITYKVETILKYKDHPYNDYYAQKYGDTLRIYFAENGDQKREYYNTGGLGYDWMIYDQDKNEFYAKWHSMDSIFYYDCSELVTTLEEFKEGEEKLILGKKCKSIITKAFEPSGKETIIQKFYFSGKEYADPNNFKYFKDGYLDKIYAKSKSHFLRWEIDLKYIYVIFEATEIKKKEIGATYFTIPDSIKLVKL